MRFQARNQLPVPINLIWQWNTIKRVAVVAPGATINIEQPVARGDNDDDNNSNKKSLVFTAFEAGTSNVAIVNDERELSVDIKDIIDGSPLQLTIKPGNIFFYKKISFLRSF